jgi:segregation and condensation protein A
MSETQPSNPATQAAPTVMARQDNESSFSVVVGQVYDGPLDLLLDLIRKQDIDIYDIPIAKITEQYLKYVETIKHLDVDVAAEFIYCWSTSASKLPPRCLCKNSRLKRRCGRIRR